MKHTTRLFSLTVVLMLFGYGGQAFGQQYIAEKVFEESQKNVHQEKAKEPKQKTVKQSHCVDDPGSNQTTMRDPGVTANPSGTEPDTII